MRKRCACSSKLISIERARLGKNRLFRQFEKRRVQRVADYFLLNENLKLKQTFHAQLTSKMLVISRASRSFVQPTMRSVSVCCRAQYASET